MIPTIIVEDGTGVINSNSYCDIDYVKHYCITRGLELPASDEEIKMATLLAMNYIESKADNFMGHLTDATQSLQFPRKLLKVNNYLRSDNEIPKELKDAQAYAAYLITTGEDLQPLVSSDILTEASVASLSAKFKQNEIVGNDGTNYFAPVDELLSRLYVKDTGYRISKRHKF